MSDPVSAQLLYFASLSSFNIKIGYVSRVCAYSIPNFVPAYKFRNLVWTLC